jgi:hypothetical protein
MRDYLLDIVKNTYGLGVISLVKIEGTEAETSIEASSEDRTIIVHAKFKNPIPEFIGTFGMPNLGKLNIILGIPEYAENADISLVRSDNNGESVPESLHFKNASGDFQNDYRFMKQSVVLDQVKTIKFKGVKWNVEFEPTVANINRLKYQANANAEETTFTAKTDGTDLKLFFGDHSNHAGSFVLQSDVNGTISKGWKWPVSAIISILSLSGNKVFRISDEGVAQITVDTGLAMYSYLLPAHSK